MSNWEQYFDVNSLRTVLEEISKLSGIAAIKEDAELTGNEIVIVPLQAGDSGIRSVQSINLSVSYVSGVLNLVLCKPLLTLPITTLGVTAERDLVNQFASMPRIYDGACLAWLMLAGAATPVGTPLSGHLEFGWNV